MEEKESARVSFEEALSIRVSRFLLANEFFVADCGGFQKVCLDEDYCVGILSQHYGTRAEKCFFGLRTRHGPRRYFLGTVWFDSGLRGASKNKWVMDIYGRENIETMRHLAKAMSEVFDVEISIKLVQEDCAFERFIDERVDY